jgi:hypothetical protein
LIASAIKRENVLSQLFAVGVEKPKRTT